MSTESEIKRNAGGDCVEGSEPEVVKPTNPAPTHPNVVSFVVKKILELV